MVMGKLCKVCMGFARVFMGLKRCGELIFGLVIDLIMDMDVNVNENERFGD